VIHKGFDFKSVAADYIYVPFAFSSQNKGLLSYGKKAEISLLSPSASGILYSPQFHSHQETKMAAR